MEVLVYILIVSLVLMELGLLAYIVWITLENRRQVAELTDKLVARSLSEYTASKQSKVVLPEKKEKKPLIDSTLGKEGNW